MPRNPKSDENLKPMKKGDLTSDEAKKRGSAGGKKSAEVRRAKRDARSAIRYLLSLPPSESIKNNLETMGFPINEQTNMAGLQARLFTMAMSGNIDAYNTLMKMAGYEPEENRRERESIASDRRREIELDAKVGALGANQDSMSAAINMSNEDGGSDVIIYMPQIASEESCQLSAEENPQDEGSSEAEEPREEPAED